MHYTRARGGAEPAAGRFSFCESGWWRRWREHSELQGRVDDRRLAPGGRWVSAVCSRQDFSRALYPLAVRRRAPRWLTFSLGRGRRARGSGSPPAARTRRVSRSENRECIASASERVPRSPASCTTRAREAEPSPPPADFLFANPVGGGGGASTASYRVASTTAGSHQEGDGSRPCARARISAVHFIRWRYGAARRAGLLLALAVAVELGGQDRRRRLAPGGSRAPKIASALHLHPKGSRVHLLRALHARARRSRARRRPIFFLRIRLVAAVARAQRATGSRRRPPARTRRAMGLGRVLAPGFQPCTLSVGGTAPRAALAYF